MTRGAPSEVSRLQLPARDIRVATAAQCPECHDTVATRAGRLAGHYAAGRELCSGSSKPITKEKP